LLELGNVATHLQLLVRLRPSTVIPRLLQRMKGGTATLINRHVASRGSALRWAKGCSVTRHAPSAGSHPGLGRPTRRFSDISRAAAISRGHRRE